MTRPAAANPVLIELSRGALVESVHRGALAVADAAGAVVLALGDVGRPVFPRSAVKVMQAMALIDTGAADRFGFAAGDLALACASHSGTPAHTTRADAMLKRAGLTRGALACGAHVPSNGEAAADLVRAGDTANRLHNNCSGKHAGMLATAVHLGEAHHGYEHPEHPVQLRARARIEAVCDIMLGADVVGIDGCSAPNWAIPLAVLAGGFARVVSGDGLSATNRATCRRLIEACWSAPEMVAGRGRFDTRLLTAFPGQVFCKTGAEGVYCGGIAGRGLGFALKIDDGGTRASEAVVAALIAQLTGSVEALDPEAAELRNWAGIAVGRIELSDALAGALRQL